MSALDYLIEAATRYPEVTIEVEPEGIRISGAVGGAIGAKKIDWQVINTARINPILPMIEKLASELEAVSEKYAL